MAEILLSLTIIGVVAAITLPSLTGNINERTWNTQRKALYARFSQAIMLMPALNGYGTLKEESSAGASDAVDTAAETFITAGLSKVLKINNICSEKLEDCGVPSKINTLNAGILDTPTKMSELNSNLVGSHSNAVAHFKLLDTKAAAFETANGESIIVYYNPNCVGSMNEDGGGYGTEYIAPKICANFIYDLNGNKGPNTVGKDIGVITAMYPSDVKVVAPYPANRPLSGTYKIKASDGETNASAACTKFDSEYRLPAIDELMSMGVNYKLFNSASSTLFSGNFWSSSKVNSSQNWDLVNNSEYDNHGFGSAFKVWCIKR